MKLQMIGCSHHDAAVEFREKISFTNEQVGEALRAFRQRFPSSVIVLISSCNRVELYATAGNHHELDRDDVAEFLADQHHLEIIPPFRLRSPWTGLSSHFPGGEPGDKILRYGRHLRSTLS